MKNHFEVVEMNTQRGCQRYKYALIDPDNTVWAASKVSWGLYPRERLWNWIFEMGYNKGKESS